MTNTKTAPTLYERLGGKAAIDAAVDLFYDKVLKDERIRHFFDGVDMKKQRQKQRAFLAYAFGAPTRYTGKDMRSAHAALVKRGLDESHFDAVAENLAVTLAELDVPAALIKEVLLVAASTKNDVLGR
jgi:hemoglobin